MTRVYKLYHSTVATGSAAAYIVFQRKGRIIGIGYSAILSTGAGGGAGHTTELSFVPTSLLTTNDTVGTVAAFSVGVAAASQSDGRSAQLMGLNVPVEQADRLYAHVQAGANASSGQFNTYVYVEE